MGQPRRRGLTWLPLGELRADTQAAARESSCEESYQLGMFSEEHSGFAARALLHRALEEEHQEHRAR